MHASELKKRLEREPVDLVRLAWADPHGTSRAKAVSLPVFLDALEHGYNIGVATTTLDSAGARVFRSFTAGGGLGPPGMTGSPHPLPPPPPPPPPGPARAPGPGRGVGGANIPP